MDVAFEPGLSADSGAHRHARLQRPSAESVLSWSLFGDDEMLRRFATGIVTERRFSCGPTSDSGQVRTLRKAVRPCMIPETALSLRGSDDVSRDPARTIAAMPIFWRGSSFYLTRCKGDPTG